MSCLQDSASEPAANGAVDAQASANNQNSASVDLASDALKGALDRQINPRGDPTPMQLPPEAQKAADAPTADLEGDSPSGTGGPTTVEVTPPKDDSPAPSADEAALEGDDSPGGTADESTPDVTVTKDDDKTPLSPPPAEVGEGADSKDGADASTDTITASGDGGASDTPSPSGVELDKGVEEDALKRQVAPKGDPTPMELPPEAQKAAQV